MLPHDPEIELNLEDLALRPQLRLERLNAMREAGARLVARDRMGRDVFPRGAAEGLRVVRKAQWQAEIYDLITAYGQIRARTRPVMHIVAVRPVMRLEDAISRVSKLIGQRIDWSTIESFLPSEAEGSYCKSALASSFVAAAGAGEVGPGKSCASNRGVRSSPITSQRSAPRSRRFATCRSARAGSTC